MSSYYLSYILNDDGKRTTLGLPQGLYHASLALTEHKPPGDPKIIAKLGLFDSSQVELEDFLKPKQGRTFYHKTYPITEEEMVRFLEKVNADRRTSNTSIKRQGVESTVAPGLQSVPGGPAYSMYKFNCKSYAMSVFDYVGIKDAGLKSWIVDDPGSGAKYLHPLKFVEGQNGVLYWGQSMELAKRLDPKKLNELSEREKYKIQTSMQFNNLQYMMKDMIFSLQDNNFKDVPGAAGLLKDLRATYENLVNFKKEYAQDLRNAQLISDSELKAIQDDPRHEFAAYCSEQNLKIQNDKQLRNAYLNYTDHKWSGKLEYKLQEWLKNCEEIIKNFEKVSASNKQKSGLANYVADSAKGMVDGSLKSTLKHLGLNLKVSDTHKARQISKVYNKNLTRLYELRANPQYNSELMLNEVLKKKFAELEQSSLSRTIGNTETSATMGASLANVQFLNKLKEALNADQDLKGNVGTLKKAQYLSYALSVVLKTDERLPSQLKEDIQQEYSSLERLRGKEQNDDLGKELETYLEQTAKKTGDRFLLDNRPKLVPEGKTDFPRQKPQ